MPTTTTCELSNALAVCARLFETDLTDRSDLELADDLRGLQELRNMLDGEFLRRLAVFDARGAAAAEHVLSTKAWLRGMLHLSPSAASGHVAVARRVRDAVPLAVGVGSGDLSYEHAVVIQRTVDAVPAEHRAEAEETLADIARFLHPADLTITAARVKEAVCPESLVTDVQTAHEMRYVTISRTLGGRVSIEGMLDPVAGAHLEAAM